MADGVKIEFVITHPLVAVIKADSTFDFLHSFVANYAFISFGLNDNLSATRKRTFSMNSLGGRIPRPATACRALLLDLFRTYSGRPEVLVSI